MPSGKIQEYEATVPSGSVAVAAKVTDWPGSMVTSVAGK